MPFPKEVILLFKGDPISISKVAVMLLFSNNEWICRAEKNSGTIKKDIVPVFFIYLNYLKLSKKTIIKKKSFIFVKRINKIKMDLLNYDFFTGFISGTFTGGMLVFVFIIMKRFRNKNSSKK